MRFCMGPNFRYFKLASACLLSCTGLLLSGCGPTDAETGTNQPALTLNEGSSAANETTEIQVGAIFNDESIQVRLRFETETPSWYHQYWVYDGSSWQRMGSGDGRDADGLYEDRISIMWDDGSVEGFDVMGGFVTVHQCMRATRSEVDRESIENHPILGQQLGLDEITKFIPESRKTPETSIVRWHEVHSLETLQQLREQGVFIDLWQWRAHRSHPVGFADNGYVLEARNSADGRSMFATNRDSETGLPKWMFNPETTGQRSLRLEELQTQSYGQEDHYFLLLEEAIPFDPDHDWQAGDAIPHRVLQQPDGSRGAIRATGRHADGAWDIRLTRSLASPNPLDSKTFEPGKVYNVAFAVHQAAGNLHHLVTIPMRFGLGTDADITAQLVQGDLDAKEIPLTSVPLFDPGDPTLPNEPIRSEQ